MRKRIAALIALSSFAGAAHAAASPTRTINGKLSLSQKAKGEEVTPADRPDPPKPSASAKLLALADANRDGSATYAELSSFVSARIQRRVAARHAQLDRDHDGRVTRAEVGKMDSARFARFDLDRDGAFTAVELSRVMALETASRLELAFAKLDTDGNSRCDLAELEQHRAAVLVAEAAAAEQKDSKRTEQAKAGGPTVF